jgi:hypothetical protein
MKKILLLVVCLAIFGCQQQIKEREIDSIKYPLVIDSGKRTVYQLGRWNNDDDRHPRWEVYLDTVTFTKGQLYRQDSVRHPLRQFYLSYPEWRTISCVVAVDLTDYWDKAMIGLIEKSGNLRVSFKEKKSYLVPTRSMIMKTGEWEGTFKNDSMEIQISGKLTNTGLRGSLNGPGNLRFKTGSQTIEEPIWLVYHMDSKK